MERFSHLIREDIGDLEMDLNLIAAGILPRYLYGLRRYIDACYLPFGMRFLERNSDTPTTGSDV